MKEVEAVINEVLGISESFELPEKMLSCLLSDDKNAMFDKFVERLGAPEFGWFTDYFQEQHSNRDKFMQDFTPKEVAYLVSHLINKPREMADICAGIGGLTISAIDNDIFFNCYELSKRAIPLLLFNLAIRNINAQVIEMNILTEEVSTCYKLTRSEKYSEITIAEPEKKSVDLVVMNPPYSVKFKELKENDRRTIKYGAPPTDKADYMFILHGLEMLKEHGTLIAILPHGALFRGNREMEIRKALIEKNLIDAIIGLPDKLFLNTQIPVCIMVLKKGKETNDIIIIDASKGFKKCGKINKLRQQDINRILTAYKQRQRVDKFAEIVTHEKIEQNDYNLNIPRYVDTSEQEVLPPLTQTLDDLYEIQNKINACEKDLFDMMRDLTGFNDSELRKIKKIEKLQKQGHHQMDWSDLF